MPFNRPSLRQLIDSGAGEIESRLPGVLARVRRSLVGVINRVVAGGLVALYKYAEFLVRQMWPDLAEDDYLDWHGARWKIPRRAAAAATGTVLFTGIDGSAIPQGSVLRRADGQEYATTAAGVIAGEQALVAVEAITPGQASSASVNTALRLSSPIDGVTGLAKAYTELDGGADAEEDEPYRSRILRRIRQPPHGGRRLDYEAWALSIAGVTRVWVYPGEQGAGSVVVRFMRDDDAGNGIPSAGEVADVQTYLNIVRPVTAAVFAVAPVAAPLAFTIHVEPDTPAIRQAVTAELTDLIRREAEPGGTLLLSHVREAVSIAVGEADNIITAPAANVVAAAGDITTMGVITWV